MAQAVCQCLNVKINLKGDFSSGKVLDSGRLSDEERKDPFFKQGPIEIKLHVLGFSIQHKFLVQSRSVGKWNVYRCYGCKTDTHAVSQSTTDPVYANKGLISNPAHVTHLQQNPRFSPVYKIVLRAEETGGRVRHASSLVPSDMDPAITPLVNTVQQQAIDFLKDEEEKMEARIMRYTEEQQSAFLTLQNRVKQDREVLLTLLTQKSTESLTEQFQGLSFTASPSKGIPMRGFASTPSFAGKNNEEDLFDFEVDGPVPSSDDPFENPDDDLEYKASSDRRQIPRSDRGRHGYDDDDMGLAKSLPISVPNMTSMRSFDIDIDDGAVPRNPEEMAASIQALARSVRGTESYWELPRPRLNTLH